MDEFKLENTVLYKKYKEESDHIQKNRWYMSERHGKDVGTERALLDWILNKKEYLNSKK